MKFFCRIGLHNYGKWSSPYRSTRVLVGFAHPERRVANFRALKCRDCGHIHEKRVSQWLSTDRYLEIDGLGTAVWPDDPYNVQRISDEVKEKFEDNILDPLWKKGGNEGADYCLAMQVYCAACGIDYNVPKQGE